MADFLCPSCNARHCFGATSASMKQECWEAVKCSTCHRYDPKGVSQRGSFYCRSCQQSQRMRGVQQLKEHCHQSIIEEASNENEVVSNSWEDLLPPNANGHLNFFQGDSDAEDDGDELAPLPATRHQIPRRAASSLSKQSPSSASSLGSWVHMSGQGAGPGASARTGHIVLALDASGSMRCTDVNPGATACMDRLQAGFLAGIAFVAEHAKLNPDDVFSVLTFSERVDRVCVALPAEEAIKAMENVYVRGAHGTKFKPALQEAARCLLSTRKQRDQDGHVVWLSDGKPSDVKSALATFQEHFVQSPRLAGTKFHGIGIGLSVDSFVALQQYVCISGGTFLLSGSNLRSLSKAFSSVSSTITAIRDDASQPPEGAGRSSAPSSLGSWMEVNEEGGLEGERGRGGGHGGGHGGGEGARPAAGPTRRAREVIYEHPELVQSFNTKGRSGTLTLSAQRSMFAFDGQVFQKQEFQSSEVQRRRRPFMRGGMRLVYGFKDAEAASNGWLVAKLSRFRDAHCNTLSIAEGHAKSTAVATYYAKLFNEKTRKLRSANREVRASLAAQLIFVPCYIYRTVEPLSSASAQSRASAAADDDAEAFAAERYLPGVFLKYNSNNGFVNDNNLLHQSIVQAFLHFSFVESRGSLLVADLQGVAREGEVLLTDPQVLSAAASASSASSATFGPGDVGVRGMHNCLAAHRCGLACKHLGLKPISPLLLKRMKRAAAAESAPPGRSASASGPGSRVSSVAEGWDRLQSPSQAPSEDPQAAWERLSEYNLTDLAGSEAQSEISASSWVHLLDV